MTPGAFSLARLLGRDYGLRCVLFHRIEDAPSAFTRDLDVGISAERFEGLIQFISSQYSPVDFETVTALRERDYLSERAVLVTFDDAYRSVATHAAVICKRYGVPAVFFVSGGLVGNTTLSSDNLICWIANTYGFEALNAAARSTAGKEIEPLSSVRQLIGDFLPGLSNQQIQLFLQETCDRLALDAAALAQEAQLYLNPGDFPGLIDCRFELANHTLSHARCRTLAPDETVRQIDGNQALLRDLTGRDSRAFSVPYGSPRDLTPDVLRRLELTGENVVFVVEGLPNPQLLDLGHINRVSLKGKNAADGFCDIEVMPRMRAIRDTLTRGRA